MKRAKFSLSNTKLLSCNMGQLIPIGLTEVLPGDSIQQSTTCLVRFAPLLAPVMHLVNIQIAHWFVPNRLVWDEWEDFITGGPLGTDASVFPTMALTAAGANAQGGLPDYLGVPPGIDITVSALPFRGYTLIWNEFYRDQDLETEALFSKASGLDATTARALQTAAWEKDYFTSARPWEQKGPTITIPLGNTAPVTRVTNAPTARAFDAGTQTVAANSAIEINTGNVRRTTGTTNISFDPNGGLVADLSSASAITVTALREALALQRFEEARARFGSRYTEYLRYLGIRSSDARLQRPEFLGGGRYPVQFSEVLQTAEGTDPVGDMKGHGIGVSRSNRYRRFFEEHGYAFTFMVVKPKTIYSSGLPRTFNRRVKEDFFQRELQHIGQQEIKNKEVRAAHATPEGTFGWANRYQEYREINSSIASEFRSTLKFWHFGRQFTTDPALNASFIKCVPTEDPFAVPSADVLYVMARHSIQARRIVSGSAQSFIY